MRFKLVPVSSKKASVIPLVILCLAGLVSCATQKPVYVGKGILVTIEGLSVEPADQFTVKAAFVLEIANPDLIPYSLKSVHSVFSSAGLIISDTGTETDITVPALKSVSIPISKEISIKELLASGLIPENSPAAPYLLTAKLMFNSGSALDAIETTHDGEFPLIREPRLEINMIKIVRDILVTTKLFLTVEIENRNGFPVTFKSITYKFYGEGRQWTAGTTDDTQEIPALTTKKITLPLSLNFASMGRDVFDLVANLKTINYRLQGESIILAGLPSIPEFRMSFDLTGNTKVTR